MLLHQANNSSIEYDSFTWSAVGVTVSVLSYKVPGKKSFLPESTLEKKNPRSFCGIKSLISALD
jgi:hypothetical protein